jgi:hypothetical protein
VEASRDGLDPSMQPGAGSPAESDDARWRAILRRDQQADGAFVYGVLTTGVYCRPGCSSRLPRRANVRFFESGEQAERAGFRPCKRCSPNTPGGQAAHAEAIAQACNKPVIPFGVLDRIDIRVGTIELAENVARPTRPIDASCGE